jgi:hypothetical protein
MLIVNGANEVGIGPLGSARIEGSQFPYLLSNIFSARTDT